MTLKQELYGLLPSLWANNNIEISTTSPYSLTKMFFSALVNLPTKKIDVFPEWDLKDLLDYLESPVFEPMSSKSLELCRVKAIILMMLATGRRLDDIQACQSWTPGTSSDGTEFISFKPFDTWKGKAVNSKDGWRPKDVVIYPIGEVSERDLSKLCPVRAFREFAKKRLALRTTSTSRLWLHGTHPDGFLSRAVIKVIVDSMIMAHPLPPVGGRPKAGTHHLRKFSFSYSYIYGVCIDLQQLWDRAGSRGKTIPLRTYIRNVPDITFYMCSPLGLLRPCMTPLRGASDPVRS